METSYLIDTHIHLDGEEFKDDRQAVVERAREAGVGRIFIPAIDYPSSVEALHLAQSYQGYVYPMLGLHPEEVRTDWREQLARIKQLHQLPHTQDESLCQMPSGSWYIAIGEVGLDYYWSREFEQEQLAAFEEQVQWAIEMELPLMIHCRKAQNEMVAILKRYATHLHGGVFHCFTGNEQEARELLQFNGFALGIGGVLTFKKSHLPEVLPAAVPLSRVVLETDAPYMAPVPHRGQRNESAFLPHVAERLAEAYGVSVEEVARQTTLNANRIFGMPE